MENLMPEMPVEEEIIVDEEITEEEIMPEPIKKEIIPTSDIFKDAPPPVIAKPKRTRKMTPEALEKLAFARVKAAETRKRNKEARAAGEMMTPSAKKAQIKEEADEKKRPITNNITHKTENITNNITHEDIKKIALQASSIATQEALEGYEAKRKARKEEKRINNLKETQKKEVKNTILKAQGYTIGAEGFYGSSCF